MTKRYAGLELLRAGAALTVVAYHYPNFALAGIYAPVPLDGMPFMPTLRPVFLYGAAAVQVFWLLSGFIFFWKYRQPIAAGGVSAWQFLVLRLSRLYPLHLVTLLAVAALQALYVRRTGTTFEYGSNDWPHALQQLAFVSNWTASQPLTFNGPIWSVSAEIGAYILFFAACALLRRSVPVLLLPLAGLVACALLLDAMPFGLQPLFECAFYFWMGGLMQAFVTTVERRRAASLLVFLLAGLAAALAVSHRSLGIAVLDGNRLIVAACCLVLASALADRVLGHGLLGRVAWVGDLTYAAYLIHFPLQLGLVLVADALGWNRAVFLTRPAFLGFILAVAVLSAAVFHGFEAPAQRAIRRLALR